MRSLLGWVVIFGLVSLGWAQAPCGVTQIVSGTDTGCTGASNHCDVTTGCTAYNFTASCTEEYYIDAYVKCTSGNPSYCVSCVQITKSDGVSVVGTCSTQGGNYCGSDFNFNTMTGIHLTAGQQYILHICLTYCKSRSDCDKDAQTDCTAYGCIRTAAGTNPCWQ
jgi:hypothetical protein